MGWLIKNGVVLDKNGKLVQKDIRVKGGKIAEIGAGLKTAGEAVFEAEELAILPGFVDLHVHLRDPGFEHKETIRTGTMAAAKGGFTTIAAMPNTNPVTDRPERLAAVQEKIKQDAVVRVLPYAAITLDEQGKELSNFAGLKAQGAFAFSDDGVGVQEADQMLRAMAQAKALGMAIVAHCEDNSLIHGGCVHDGKFAAAHGLKGIPSVCESVQIARDVLLAEATGCHYHVCHISTKESVRVVRDAKRAGIPVTAEVTPHHLLLCEDDIPDADANWKMNPPLRTKEDRDALIGGLLDGTIDFIATDHAPHAAEEKAKGIELAPFGITGFETAFPLLYTHFVEQGIFTLKQLVDWMTVKPSKAFGLPYGVLEVGAAADITAVDIKERKIIIPYEFLSKGKNSPFGGRVCTGFPAATWANGELVWGKELAVK
ncbi:dihydroorotase [Weizmannia acidilactici]|jgi:dihydroorotase|uniref:Dihydroorotase n=1 Tax=Weizmannia acidilactici TaxID=2607726 RepID=A0A5J4J688_9BACI|nr:dihydroorotase [Weizmannia acidilactici]GER65546.1 dihydroorotase [Weizmannia acidilactici]GER70442.1 dihydroorotase [Weizmannia acidilactici]GER74086.1 dihydroorotase [Weizmannia acidilactici]